MMHVQASLQEEDPEVLAESLTHAEREFSLGHTPGDFEQKTLHHLDATRSSNFTNDIIACFSAKDFLPINQCVKVSWFLSVWLFITKHVLQAF
jgi:hypothetical protein